MPFENQDESVRAEVAEGESEFWPSRTQGPFCKKLDTIHMPLQWAEIRKEASTSCNS